MIKKFLKLILDRSGVTAIEYGLIAAMVGVAIIGGVTLLGGSLNTMFTDVSATLDGATGGLGAGVSTGTVTGNLGGGTGGGTATP